MSLSLENETTKTYICDCYTVQPFFEVILDTNTYVVQTKTQKKITCLHNKHVNIRNINEKDLTCHSQATSSNRQEHFALHS